MIVFSDYCMCDTYCCLSHFLLTAMSLHKVTPNCLDSGSSPKHEYTVAVSFSSSTPPPDRLLCPVLHQTVNAVPAVKRVDSAFCPACSRAMDPGESMADHLLTHLAPGLRCVQCGLVVATHQEMQAHWTFTWRCDCSACDTHVGRGARLLQHIIEDHDGVSATALAAGGDQRTYPCPRSGDGDTLFVQGNVQCALWTLPEDGGFGLILNLERVRGNV